MAARKNLTSVTAPASAPLPLSIYELGKHLAVADREANSQCSRMVKNSGGRDRLIELEAEDTLKVLSDRAWTLRELIGMLPAETLADAAVQMKVAFGLAEILEGDNTPEEASRMTSAVARLTVSALVVVAVAAGLDLAEMGMEEHGDLHALRFALDKGDA